MREASLVDHQAFGSCSFSHHSSERPPSPDYFCSALHVSVIRLSSPLAKITSYKTQFMSQSPWFTLPTGATVSCTHRDASAAQLAPRCPSTDFSERPSHRPTPRTFPSVHGAGQPL